LIKPATLLSMCKSVVVWVEPCNFFLLSATVRIKAAIRGNPIAIDKEGETPLEDRLFLTTE